MASPTRPHLWALRGAWVALALGASAAGGEALDGRSTAVAVTATVIAWAGWGVALAAMGVPRTLSLTVVRILVPAGALGALWAAATGPGASATGIVTSVVAVASLVLVLVPGTTDGFVDGSAYGPERRLALRTPIPFIVLAAITWAVVVVGALAGPLLAAAGTWVAATAAVVVGWPVAALGARSLHQLSRRWLVLVPNGLVVHDPLTMPEPQLFLRQTMARLGPAASDLDGDVVIEDLTAGATGLVMELDLDEPVELLVRRGRRGAEASAVDAVRFTPSLPAELLAEAGRRRWPVS